MKKAELTWGVTPSDHTAPKTPPLAPQVRECAAAGGRYCTGRGSPTAGTRAAAAAAAPQQCLPQDTDHDQTRHQTAPPTACYGCCVRHVRWITSACVTVIEGTTVAALLAVVHVPKTSHARRTVCRTVPSRMCFSGVTNTGPWQVRWGARQIQHPYTTHYAATRGLFVAVWDVP